MVLEKIIGEDISFTPEKMNELFKFLNELKEEINEKYKYYSERVSQLEKALLDIDHAFELLELPADKLSKLTKARKYFLTERRIAKEEIQRIDILKQRFSISVQTVGEPHYTYSFRTDAVQRILNIEGNIIKEGEIKNV